MHVVPAKAKPDRQIDGQTNKEIPVLHFASLAQQKCDIPISSYKTIFLLGVALTLMGRNPLALFGQMHAPGSR